MERRARAEEEMEGGEEGSERQGRNGRENKEKIIRTIDINACIPGSVVEPTNTTNKIIRTE